MKISVYSMKFEEKITQNAGFPRRKPKAVPLGSFLTIFYFFSKKA
jgi:hypothetical protein